MKQALADGMANNPPLEGGEDGVIEYEDKEDSAPLLVDTSTLNRKVRCNHSSRILAMRFARVSLYVTIRSIELSELFVHVSLPPNEPGLKSVEAIP